MEVYKQYLEKMRRHVRAGIITAVLVLSVAIWLYQPAKVIYRIETNYLVSQEPLESTLQAEEERYYHWVMSESVTYSLADWTQGTEFAERVQQRLMREHDLALTIDDLVDSISAGAIRSRLIVAFASTNESELEKIAAAGSAEMASLDVDGLDVPQFALAQPEVQPLDPEFLMEEIDLTVGQRLALPIRVVLSLLAGVGGARSGCDGPRGQLR